MSTVYHAPITTGQAAQAAVINRPLEQLDAALTAMWGSNPGETSAMTTTFHTPISTAQIAANAAAINAPLAQLDAAIALLQRRFDYPTAPFVYVDSVSGNDGNAGTSAAAPLKTLSALPALTDGATVYLRKGSHWREQLEVTADNVAVLAYGTGANPLLDCSDVIDAGDWSKTGGLTDVYEATVALDTVANGWVSAWEDDVRLVRVASTAACDATAGSYYPSADTGASITLYVHATDDADPGSSGAVFEYSARQAGVKARTATALSLNGLTTRRNYHDDGSIIVGPFADIRNCTASEGTKHNILVERGSYLYNVLADNCYYAGQPTAMFVYNTDVANGEDVTFESCTAQNDALVVNAGGFYGHSNTGGNFGTVLLKNCVVSNCSLAVDGAFTDIFRTDGLVTTGCTTALRPSDADVGLWDFGGVVHVGGGEAPGYEMPVRLEDAATVILHDCTFTPAVALQGTIRIAAAGNFTIEDCEFTCADANNPILVYGDAAMAGATLDFQRNTYTGFFHYYYYLPAAVTLTSDYNAFVSSADNFHLDGDTYNSLAAWQGAGYDAHSTAS